LAMGVAGVLISFITRMPVFVAWSTPGAALLAATGATPGGFPAAVGAFIVVGAVIAASGRGAGFDLVTITPRLAVVAPTLSLDAIIGLALPLFLVTMA